MHTIQGRAPGCTPPSLSGVWNCGWGSICKCWNILGRRFKAMLMRDALESAGVAIGQLHGTNMKILALLVGALLPVETQTQSLAVVCQD